MRIKEFKIGFSRTLSPRQFESVRIENHLIVEVPENEDFERLKALAQSELKKLNQETYRIQFREENYD